MNRFSLSHVADPDLLRSLRSLVAQDRATTALLVAHLGEVDARRLYAEAGYPSMFAYCVEVLGFSEDGAYKRIRAARAARQFPAIHGMLAVGRLHLSAVVALAPHLSPGTRMTCSPPRRAGAGRKSSNSWPSDSRGPTCRA